MKTHKDLEIWKNSIDIVEDVYAMTQSFPHEEIYGLTSQIRRASVSIPSNIAEGAARQTDKEFIQFLYMALGSLSELETQVIIALKLGFIKEDKILQKIEILRKQLLSFIKYKKLK